MIFVLAVTSHIRCQFTQPGCVPKNLTISKEMLELNSQKRRRTTRPCRHCQIMKPKDAHHCSVCNRCIIRMDHHCPWVNNCVGALNQKYFLLFLLYTFLCSFYCLGTLVHHFISCSGGGRSRHRHGRSARPVPDWCNADGPEDIGAVMSMAFNFVEGIMFGLFTLIMGCDQLSHILSGSSTIDKLQGKTGEKRGAHDSLSLVFGGAFSLTWFLPVGLTKKIIKDFESA